MNKENPKPKKIELAFRDEWPICPHCEKEIEQMLSMFYGRMRANAVFYCPHCRKVLGTSGVF